MSQGKGRFWDFFVPVGLNGTFLTEMYSTRACKVGVYGKICKKCNSDFSFSALQIRL